MVDLQLESESAETKLFKHGHRLSCAGPIRTNGISRVGPRASPDTTGSGGASDCDPADDRSSWCAPLTGYWCLSGYVECFLQHVRLHMAIAARPDGLEGLAHSVRRPSRLGQRATDNLFSCGFGLVLARAGVRRELAVAEEHILLRPPALEARPGRAK